MAGVNKVVFDGEVLIDLTNDTVDKTKLLKGFTAHQKDGSKITGTLQIRLKPSLTVEDTTIMLVRGYGNEDRIRYGVIFI